MPSGLQHVGSFTFMPRPRSSSRSSFMFAFLLFAPVLITISACESGSETVIVELNLATGPCEAGTTCSKRLSGSGIVVESAAREPGLNDAPGDRVLYAEIESHSEVLIVTEIGHSRGLPTVRYREVANGEVVFEGETTDVSVVLPDPAVQDMVGHFSFVAAASRGGGVRIVTQGLIIPVDPRTLVFFQDPHGTVHVRHEGWTSVTSTTSPPTRPPQRPTDPVVSRSPTGHPPGDGQVPTVEVVTVGTTGCDGPPPETTDGDGCDGEGEASDQGCEGDDESSASDGCEGDTEAGSSTGCESGDSGSSDGCDGDVAASFHGAEFEVDRTVSLLQCTTSPSPRALEGSQPRAQERHVLGRVLRSSAARAWPMILVGAVNRAARSRLRVRQRDDRRPTTDDR